MTQQPSLEPVSTDLPAKIDGWSAVAESLKELRFGSEESSRFFSSLFEEMESVLSQLLQEQEQWRDDRRRVESELETRSAQIEQQQREIAEELTKIEQLRATGDALPAAHPTECRAIMEETQRERAALADVLQAAQDQMTGLADIATTLGEALNRTGDTVNGDHDLRAIIDEQLQKISGDIQKERASLHDTIEASRRQTADLAEAMSALIASHEQHVSETSQNGGPDSDAWKESEIHIRQLLDQTSSELVALREALSSQGPPAQEWTGMHEQLAETRKELADARAQIERLARPLEAAVQEGSSLGRDDRSEAEMAALREERDAILQERSLLEAELDHVRRRAAQLAEHLEDERRSGTEQEQHWREEFRRHRGLLEDLTSRLATLPAMPVGGAPAYAAAQPAPQAAQAAPSPAPAPPQNDAALEAVRAQFELLQKEAIRRRRESK